MANKTAVVTGATSAIGTAFARQGYDLVITGRRKEKSVICTPGANTKRLTRLLRLMPRKRYYRFRLDFSRKNFGKKVG